MNPIIVPISVALLAAFAIADYDSYCPRPEEPHYGYISYGKQDYYKVGSEIEYSCNEGYKLYGDKRARCVIKGKVEYWNGSPPECKKVRCEDLDDPDYGKVWQSGSYPGDKATYKCNYGYTLYGPSKRKCLYSGYWSDEEPECKKQVRCGKLSHPHYGKVQQSGYHPGSKATYKCDYGYKLYGASTRKCLYTGYWSDKEPECKKLRCEDLDHPHYGKVKVSGYYPGDKATYKCDYGYKLYGASKRKCLYTGYWSDKEPECKRIRCEDLDHPHYGKVKLSGYYPDDEATYKCDYGYKLWGSRVRKCLYSGYWSDKEPVCKKIRCKDLDHPHYGKVKLTGYYPDDEATYKCDYGYKLWGSKVRKCLYSGYWSDKEPVCKKIRCDDLDHPHYGKVWQSGYYPGAKATYKCDYGYKLYGPSKRKCLYTGYWSDKEPECKKVRCKDLSHPDYGKVWQSGYYPGDKANYKCDYGYTLYGSSQRKCLYNGYWSGEEPKCIYKKVCGKLPHPDYGKVSVKGYYATYKCDYGYKLVGNYRRVCKDGYWEGDAPYCVKTYKH